MACLAGAAIAGEEHIVEVSGFSFTPEEISVQPGDTIRWVWGGGDHTVTSGSNCTFDGIYFNELVDPDNPEFLYVVPDDVSGEIPYFCIPHCAMFGMVGTIVIETPLIPGDLNNTGNVDGADLAILLGSWGPCKDCDDCLADIDGSCQVDGSDLAILLGNWG